MAEAVYDDLNITAFKRWSVRLVPRLEIGCFIRELLWSFLSSTAIRDRDSHHPW